MGAALYRGMRTHVDAGETHDRSGQRGSPPPAAGDISEAAVAAAASGHSPGPDLASLPDALLESIFAQLDAHTLLQRVALVNRRFRSVAESETLWLARLPPALASALRSPPGGASSSSTWVASPPRQPLYPRLYCSLRNANLLRNPWFCLEEQRRARRARAGDAPGRSRPPWLVAPGNGGSRWAWGSQAEEGLVMTPGVERMPPPPLPPYTPQGPPSWRRPGAVASSYSWGCTIQEVDLLAELRLRGVPEGAACAFLDACPALVLEVFVAGRFDCQGWFEACVVLDGRTGPVPQHSAGMDAWMAGAAAVASLPRQDVEANVWRRKQLRVQASAPGVRRAVVVLVGSERRFWAGCYGCKFAAPQLRFECDEAGF